ncbi:MAG: NTP transferase domain-containing protein [Actinobacteria bacterium]|nr:NTP transferase domain-containing protein [Actinomycetota bacterium]
MELCAVVLAAGLGTRLRPLTDLRPKALCPVDNVALLDHAIGRAKQLAGAVAVNGLTTLEVALAARDVHASIEGATPLGTAGALQRLRGWIDGRDVVVVNADAFIEGDLSAVLPDDGTRRPRLAAVEDARRPDFGGRWRYVGVCVLPFSVVERLEPGGLYDQVFARAELDIVPCATWFTDCGTPGGYHAANMRASGGRNVVGEGARVDGRIERCVVWPGSVVEEHEQLHDAIRADGLTVRVE